MYIKKNKSIMKKYFIIAVAAMAAMAACTKVDPVNNTTKDTAISFSVINHLQQTRATEGLTYPTGPSEPSHGGLPVHGTRRQHPRSSCS